MADESAVPVTAPTPSQTTQFDVEFGLSESDAPVESLWDVRCWHQLGVTNAEYARNALEQMLSGGGEPKGGLYRVTERKRWGTTWMFWVRPRTVVDVVDYWEPESVEALGGDGGS